MFVGYYRRFIKDFSKVAKPLNELLRGTGGSRGQRSNFDYTIKYCLGRDHTNTDVLSRLPVSPTNPTAAERECDEGLLVRIVGSTNPGGDWLTSWGWDPDHREKTLFSAKFVGTWSKVGCQMLHRDSYFHNP